MKKLWEKYWFRIVLIAIVFAYHSFVYWISPLFIPSKTIEMPSWMVTIFDDVPIIPFFMVFYFGCFIWWVIAFSVASKERVYNMPWVVLFGYIIIAICFVVFPVTIHWDEIPGNDIFANLMRFLRTIDLPVKLFPSIHVFVSAVAYLAVAFDKKQKIWIRILGFFWLIAVWASTLFLQQHYFVDGLAGTLLAIIIFLIVKNTKLSNLISKWEDNWKMKIEQKKSSNNDDQKE